MPVDILLYALIAGGLVLWLRSVLGTRHGEERVRPNPYIQKAERSGKEDKTKPVKDQEIKTLTPVHQTASFDEVTQGSEVANTLHQIQQADPDFDINQFLTLSKDAFAYIVESFAAGDKEALEPLLSPKVFNVFSDAIDARQAKGETISTEITAVKKAELVEATVKKTLARLAVRFTAEEISVTYDASGNILYGSPDRCTQMVDVWVFERKFKSKDPTWRLVETREDEIEEHKTPIPEIENA